MLCRASAAIHLCLFIVGCGSVSGCQAFDHALCLGGANGFRGFSGNFRADIRQCMIHLSQFTNSF